MVLGTSLCVETTHRVTGAGSGFCAASGSLPSGFLLRCSRLSLSAQRLLLCVSGSFSLPSSFLMRVSGSLSLGPEASSACFKLSLCPAASPVLFQALSLCPAASPALLQALSLCLVASPACFRLSAQRLLMRVSGSLSLCPEASHACFRRSLCPAASLACFKLSLCPEASPACFRFSLCPVSVCFRKEQLRQLHH